LSDGGVTASVIGGVYFGASVVSLEERRRLVAEDDDESVAV
jgi:hypothetical protein